MAKGILKKGKLVMVLAAIGSCLCLIGCAAKEDATEAVNYACLLYTSDAADEP